MRVSLLLIMMVAGLAVAQTPIPRELAEARQAIAAKNYARAHELYAAYAAKHPDNAAAQLGVGESEIGLHQYEAAEYDLRRAVDLDPELWVAHKDLVLVEAKLHRWEDFDRERKLLRDARLRGAANITATESDLIDSFDVKGQEWLVREYFVPVGRSETRYNFEHFAPSGRAEEYISLEPAAAAQAALSREQQVPIGRDKPLAPRTTDWALNWYTGHGHGTIRHYAAEPGYEKVRADVVRWLESRAR